MIAPWRKLGMSPNKRLELHFDFDLGKTASPVATIRRTDTRPGQKATKESLKHVLSDDFEVLPVKLILDNMGYIEDLDVPVDQEEEMQHEAEMVDNFLAHYGVKGMKWGIRRNRDSGGSSGSSSKSSEKADKAAQKDMDKMPAGSVVPVKNQDGSTKLLLKKKDGTWKETYVSVDAEKFIRARQKAGHELSDRELKETLERARMVENYQKMFGDQPNRELQARVDAMRLETEYRNYKEKLDPPKKSLVKKFVAGSESAYSAYKRLDEISGGTLSKQVRKKMGQAFDEAGKDSPAVAKFKAGQQKQSTPGPKVKGFRGKTPPAPWGTAPRSGTTSPGGVRINQNPLFQPKKTSSGKVFNISDVGKNYRYPDPSIPQIGTRGGS